MRRVPEFDALRGLAAMAIVAFHLNPREVYPGWTGVDLFFVLSGFLITGIILRHGHAPGFLPTFYVRRGLRIWPIYYLTLLVLAGVNPYLPRPESLAGLPYYLTYTQNLPLYWREKAPDILAFNHTWTLALEEQFYVIWPALLLMAGRKRVVPVCLATIALAWLAREGGWISRSPFSERLLIARCDGFALGGLLAAILENGRSRAKTLGLASALLGAASYLAWGMIASGNPIGFLGCPTPAWPSTTILAVNVLFFGLVGVVASGAGGLWLAMLRFRPLTYLGQISYGLYLYHYPTFWAIDGFAFVYQQPWPIRVLKILATLFVAVVSWHLIESPILGLKGRFGYDRKRPGQVVDSGPRSVVD